MRAESINLIGESIYEISKKCPHCKERSFFAFNKEEYERLFVKNEFVHVVFPDLSAEEREVMISGTHPKCWNEMFENLDEDLDEDDFN